MSPCLALLMAFTKHIPWTLAAPQHSRVASGRCGAQGEGSLPVSYRSIPGRSPVVCEELFHRAKSISRDLSGHKPLTGKGAETPKPPGAHPQPALAEERECPASCPSIPQPQNNNKKRKREGGEKKKVTSCVDPRLGLKISTRASHCHNGQFLGANLGFPLESDGEGGWLPPRWHTERRPGGA